MKIIQVKELPQEIISVDNADCLMNSSAETTTTIEISTETNTELHNQELRSHQLVYTIPITNSNWQHDVYEFLKLFANNVFKKGTSCFAAMIIISYIIGFQIDDQSMTYAIARLLGLLPLMWIRQSDELTQYIVKQMTDFYENYIQPFTD